MPPVTVRDFIQRKTNRFSNVSSKIEDDVNDDKSEFWHDLKNNDPKPVEESFLETFVRAKFGKQTISDDENPTGYK